MALLDFYGMFDYAAGDDDTYAYSSAEFSELIAGITGNGVSKNTLNSFATTASALKLTVKSGVCFINGRYGANHASKTVTVSSVASGSTRYDRLVIELSIPNRNMDLKLVKGTASTGTPAVPALTQNDSTWQLPLYLCLVSGSTVTLTDERHMTYSVTQIETELANRSLVGHGHALSEITGISLNTTASNIKMDGTASAGSGTAVAKANHVHPTDTSRAAASHTHAAGDITSGTLPAARGGTGQTTLVNAANGLVNALATGSNAPQDADYYIAQYTGGGTTTTTYHRKPFSTLWSYIKGKADAVYAALSHTHALADVTGISLNTTATNIKMDGTQSAGSGTSVAKANHVHPTDTSRAAAEHTHAASDITSGTLPAARGGTGQTTLVNAANALINALTTGTSTPKDADYYVCQYAGGGTTTTTYYRRPVSALWTYMKSKADAVYAALSHTHALADVTGISLNTTASNIKMDGTASAGSGTAVAKANHVHPTDTSRAAASHTHDDRYFTETEINTKLSNILANPNATTAATTDLNTFRTGGVYNIWVNGQSPAHSPRSGGGLHILVVFSYGNYGVQLLFCCQSNTSTTQAWVLTFFDSSTFQEWKALH